MKVILDNMGSNSDAMLKINSSVSRQHICAELPTFAADKSSTDLEIAVDGRVFPVHSLVLSVLGRRVARLLRTSEADRVIFPADSVEEVGVLINYLYKGVKGFISLSLAQALGLDQPVSKQEILDQEELLEDKKVFTTPDESCRMSLMEADVKMEIIEQDEPESQPVFYDEDADYIPTAAAAPRKKKTRGRPPGKLNRNKIRIKTEYSDETTPTDFKSVDNSRRHQADVKDFVVDGEEDDDWFDSDRLAAARMKAKQKGKELAEEMTVRLAAEPHRFRFYNRLHYSGSGKNRRNNETDEEYFQRLKLYDRYPGLIYDDECTRFVVCKECGFVTKNIPSSHRCTKIVDYLRSKPVEMFRRMHFSSHLSKYFKQKADKVECKVCLSILPSMDDFKVHLKELHNIEPLLYKHNSLFGDFVCEDCGKRFTTMNLMKQHEVTKHGKRELAKFCCEPCDLHFVTKTNLDTHVQRVHENYRPHVCEECAKSFKVKRHLLAHRRTHTGEKSFQCRHCEKRFAKEWTRTQHERLHLGLKPYKCEICHQRFSQKTSLDCHTKTHHSKPSQAL